MTSDDPRSATERLLDPLPSDGAEPLYRQLKARVLSLIGPGGFAPSAKLPSERELRERLGLSRITVRQALTELVQTGHLRSQAGKGFFVAARREPFDMQLLRSFTANAQAHGLTPGSRLLEARTFAATPEIASPLGLAPGALTLELKRLRLLDSEPVVVQTDWLDAQLVPGLLSLDWTRANRSLYSELATRYRLLPIAGHTIITARGATPDEAEALQLRPGAAVLVLDQAACDASGRWINLSRSVHHPDRYPLRVNENLSGGP